ncbi:MAG: phospholipid carrier-dependent glycosyltransferase [Bacilli bacterium]|nr:phospholipid carrier-dependent glycosyltransferase [Bacilli bacterium]
MKTTMQLSSRDVKNERIVYQIFLLVIAFIFIIASYIFVVPYTFVSETEFNVEPAKFFGALMFLAIGIYAYVMHQRHQMTFETKIFIIILLSFAIHLTYILYTPGDVRQHDTWSTNHDSHYDYALSFYLTGTFPDHNITIDTIYQFYHPPLNAIFQAGFMHFFEFFCPIESLTSSPENLYSACQILSCFYMLISSVFMVKIVLMSKLSHSSKLMASAFVALFPRLIQLSGQLNNDSLALALSILALYFFCRWYFVKKSYINIIMTALFIGLAMMSKMSAVVICFGIAIAFIIELVKSIQKKTNSLPLKHLIFQYVIFLLICAPLGLWFQFYTHYVYGLPWNFVFSRLNAALFTGTKDWVLANKPDSIDYYNSKNAGAIYENNAYNIFKRFIVPIDFSELFNSTYIFCSSWQDYCILSYALRSSIFGEFSYSAGGGIAAIAVLAIFLLWFLFIAYLIYQLIKRPKFGRDGTFSLYLTLGCILMYVYFQISMPYGCSMDFRYIVPIILPIGYLLGKANDMCSTGTINIFKRIYKPLLNATVFIFLASSFLFYFVTV